MRKISGKVKKVLYKTIIFLIKIIDKILKGQGVNFYVKRGKKALGEKGFSQAIAILERGLILFPDNYRLHIELARIKMANKEWGSAITHWNVIFKAQNKEMVPNFYLGYANSLKNNKEIQSATKVLSQGLNHFPANKQIIIELASILVYQMKWKSSIKLWNKYLEIGSSQPLIKAYTDLALAYRKTGNFSEAEDVLKKGIKVYPNNRKVRNQFAVIAIHMKKWDLAIKRLEENRSLYSQNQLPLTMLIRLSMLYQIIGNYEKADSIFEYVLNHYSKQINEDKKGFRKITLFDNGESRIEFYKKLKKTDKVMLTFDSINMVWKNKPFGFKLLKQQNVDIIAVRKRKKGTYQQDLSQRDFLNSVSILVGGYGDKIAYGFSLGAYTALYFSTLLDCRVLAISPRLSIHPVYGRERIISKFDFNHDLSYKYNTQISPIVVFDPKNTLDNTYVQKEIIQSFPNAELVKVPYGGHGMAPHLLKMGLLKEFVLTMIDGDKIPRYDRKRKTKSSIYYRLLGQNCLNHNKEKWARDLAERSLEMLPTDKLAIKLKVNVLRKMNQYENALKYIKEAIILLPKDLSIRLLLIDLYIENGYLIAAKKELSATNHQFKGSRELSKRHKIINEKRD